MLAQSVKKIKTSNHTSNSMRREIHPWYFSRACVIIIALPFDLKFTSLCDTYRLSPLIMESGKRSKNFTEREKMVLIEVAKEFVCVIDNKKTDGTSVEAKKQAWMSLTNKFNAVSETGTRTEKQLHALYDNLKKKARKNMSDDKVGLISYY